MKDLGGYIRDEELKRFIDCIEPLRDRLIFNLLYRTGRRVGEVLKLKVRDIDFESNKIIWTIEKKNPIKLKRRSRESDIAFNYRKKTKLINKPLYQTMKFIDPICLNLLKQWIEMEKLQAQDYVFKSVNKRNKMFQFRGVAHLSRFTINGLCRKYGKISGITHIGSKPLHPHHFRHTYAIRKIKRLKTPAEIVKLRDWLEHSSLDITQFYLQFRDDEMKDMIDEEVL